ncbi:MAG TPA: aldo/keto reductase [Planctomycetota bacterium]|nr:aldo/keto reductase [Planctomycetota bacterium]
MRSYDLDRGLSATRIMYGCMPLGGSWDGQPPTAAARARAVKAVRAALDAGIDCFDHADIYCRGASEAVFADALAEIGAGRDRLVLQSKCGIRFAGEPDASAPARYDFSYAHIVAATEGILARLRTDRLDLLVLHRPDALVEPEEVARAFDHLHAAGKVRHVGVSNHTAAQIELMRRHVRQRIVVNQVQLSLVHSHLIDDGVFANTDTATHGVAGTLDYCRLHGITIQAWGPLGGGAALGGAQRPELAKRIAAIRARAGCAAEAVPIAWLLRHPARIQPIIGSTDPARIAAACAADAIELSREEWYALATAARGRPGP